MALIRSSSVSPASPSAKASPSSVSSASNPASPVSTSHVARVKERVSSAFDRLGASAFFLNGVSDELGKPIAAIDEALKALNLGVSAWVEFAGDVDHNSGFFWQRSIGYAKVSGKWGISICASSGDPGNEPDEEFWLFGDAPRSYRLEAVDKLPDLIEKLITAADETTVQLKEKISTTNQIADAISSSSTRLRDVFLAKIRETKKVFYNMVVAQAQKIEVNGDRVTFTFSLNQRTLRDQVEQQRPWLESIAQQVFSGPVSLAIVVQEADGLSADQNRAQGHPGKLASPSVAKK